MARKGLSRHKVAGAAVEVVRAEGIDKVTMRRVGRQLGCEAMSLYTWVDSKEDLEAAMCERLLAPDVVDLLDDVARHGTVPAGLIRQARRFLIVAAVTGDDFPPRVAYGLGRALALSVHLKPEVPA